MAQQIESVAYTFHLRGGRFCRGGEFVAYRKALGLDDGLDLYSYRRSYVTHIIEDGWDRRFVQEQAGRSAR